MWRGPIAGFRLAAGLRRGWLVELLDVDVCPWADDDAAAIFDWGVASVLEYARMFGAEWPAQRRRGTALDAITVPESINGPQVGQWLARYGDQPQLPGHT